MELLLCETQRWSMHLTLRTTSLASCIRLVGQRANVGLFYQLPRFPSRGVVPFDMHQVEQVRVLCFLTASSGRRAVWLESEVLSMPG